MTELTFFTPVSYKNIEAPLKSRMLQKVDDYFYLGGKKAYVIGNSKNGTNKVVLTESHASTLASTAKILSYCTILIPIIMLGAKAILRSMHNFKVKKLNISAKTNDNLDPQEDKPKINENNKGFLYEIKQDQQTVGYLCGTQHYMPQSWNGLNSEIQATAKKCEMIFFETVIGHEEIKAFENEINGMGCKLGADFELIAFSRDKKIKMESLDSPQSNLNKCLTLIKLQMQTKLAIQKQEFDPKKSFDNEIQAWLNGDELMVCTEVATKAKFAKDAIVNLTNDRNEEWMIKISEALKHSQTKIEKKPIFIAVGASHLFDCKEISTGLISRIRELNYTVETIGADYS